MQTHYTSSYLVLVLTFDNMIRYGANMRPDDYLTPSQENEVKEFIAMTREPDFNVRNTSCNGSIRKNWSWTNSVGSCEKVYIKNQWGRREI